MDTNLAEKTDSIFNNLKLQQNSVNRKSVRKLGNFGKHKKKKIVNFESLSKLWQALVKFGKSW